MNLIKQKEWFDSTKFEKEYHCDAPLGAFLTSSIIQRLEITRL